MVISSITAIIFALFYSSVITFSDTDTDTCVSDQPPQDKVCTHYLHELCIMYPYSTLYCIRTVLDIVSVQYLILISSAVLPNSNCANKFSDQVYFIIRVDVFCGLRS